MRPAKRARATEGRQLDRDWVADARRGGAAPRACRACFLRGAAALLMGIVDLTGSLGQAPPRLRQAAPGRAPIGCSLVTVRNWLHVLAPFGAAGFDPCPRRSMSGMAASHASRSTVPRFSTPSMMRFRANSWRQWSGPTNRLMKASVSPATRGRGSTSSVAPPKRAGSRRWRSVTKGALTGPATSRSPKAAEALPASGSTCFSDPPGGQAFREERRCAGGSACGSS